MLGWIFIDIFAVILTVMVLEFLYWGRAAFKAIAEEHADYVQQCEDAAAVAELARVREQFKDYPRPDDGFDIPITPAGKAHRHNLNDDECVDVNGEGTEI